MQAQLPLAPLAADKLPPALVLGSDADPLVDVTDVEVGTVSLLPCCRLTSDLCSLIGV